MKIEAEIDTQHLLPTPDDEFYKLLAGRIGRILFEDGSMQKSKKGDIFKMSFEYEPKEQT